MESRDKTLQIFRDLAGERAGRLDSGEYLADVAKRITTALSDEDKKVDTEVTAASGVGFHLVDWQHDAAFIVALALFPERFTDEEIREGVDAFLIHVPAHVLEAARLVGYDTHNVFEEKSDYSGGK